MLLQSKQSKADYNKQSNIVIFFFLKAGTAPTPSCVGSASLNLKETVDVIEILILYYWLALVHIWYIFIYYLFMVNIYRKHLQWICIVDIYG